MREGGEGGREGGRKERVSAGIPPPMLRPLSYSRSLTSDYSA